MSPGASKDTDLNLGVVAPALGLGFGLAAPLLGLPTLALPVAASISLSLAALAIALAGRVPAVAIGLITAALGLCGNAVTADQLRADLAELPGATDLDRVYRLEARVRHTWETPYGHALSIDRIAITSPAAPGFSLERLTLYLPPLAAPPDRLSRIAAWVRLGRSRDPRPFDKPFEAVRDRYRPRLYGSVKSVELIDFTPAPPPRDSGLSQGNRELVSLFFAGRPSYLWRERLAPFGLGHLLAISGLHCVFVFLGLQLLLFPIRRPLVRALMTVAGLLLFADWVGWTASVTRASLMLIAWQLMPALNRGRSWLGLWAGLALLLMTTDPLILLERGFWYSFVASLGLILGARHLARGPMDHPWLRRARTFLPIVGAQLMVVPVNLLFGHESALTDLIWNLIGMLALALLAALLALAVLATWLAFLVPLANAAESAVNGLLGLAAGMPEPATLIRFPHQPITVLVVVTLVAFLLLAAKRELRWYFALASITVFAFLNRPLDGDRLVMLDVGQGLSILHVDDKGHGTLFDAGGELPPGTEPGHVLRLYGVESLRSVYVTHLDLDHYGFVSDLPKVPTLVAARDLATARADPILAGSPLRGLAPEQNIALGPYRIEVLWPPIDAAIPNDNEASLVMTLTGTDFTMLITGDAGTFMEPRLDLPSLSGRRVLQVGHHGSRSASGLGFLTRFGPQWALISCGRSNRFGHPHPTVVDRLQAVGARIENTAEKGSITIARRGRLSLEESGGD